MSTGLGLLTALGSVKLQFEAEELPPPNRECPANPRSGKVSFSGNQRHQEISEQREEEVPEDRGRICNVANGKAQSRCSGSKTAQDSRQMRARPGEES